MKGKGKGMFRFYRDFVCQMLFALLELKCTGITNMDRLRDNATSNYRRYNSLIHGENGQAIVNVINMFRNEYSGNEEWLELDEMIEFLCKQLQASYSGTESDDGTLVDSIVETLNLPYAKNVLTGRNLELLKRAILLPEEMAKIGSVLAQRELSCGSCGHRFVAGEMARLYPDGRGNNSFDCTRCGKPLFMACDKCDEGTVQIDHKKIANMFRKPVLCERHQPSPNGEQKSVAVTLSGPTMGVAAEGVIGGGEANIAGRVYLDNERLRAAARQAGARAATNWITFDSEAPLSTQTVQGRDIWTETARIFNENPQQLGTVTAIETPSPGPALEPLVGDEEYFDDEYADGDEDE